MPAQSSSVPLFSDEDLAAGNKWLKQYVLMSTEFYHFQAAQMCRIHP